MFTGAGQPTCLNCGAVRAGGVREGTKIWCIFVSGCNVHLAQFSEANPLLEDFGAVDSVLLKRPFFRHVNILCKILF